MIRAFAVAKRQTKNNFVPRLAERRVMAVRQTFHGEGQGGFILRISMVRVAPHRPRKLIEQDDEIKPSVRIEGPLGKIACGSFCRKINKPLGRN